ncbi:filamentous hemagglutinin N-terminal domain-containing protein, partial [Pseudomonas protegens]|uniref:filamentous hemagglutinin N-terminal domain-containing protein n=1 Tax=Pseudomonas protegens TaxID=380021 RepID=UPI000CCDC9AE
MDVRHFTFLAQQPSAVLQSRDSFCGLSKRSLAFVLANMMFWQPLVAMADGIVVNGSGTTLGQAGNGVPIVNIATPNGSGLSHNKCRNYPARPQGMLSTNDTTRPHEDTVAGTRIRADPHVRPRHPSTPQQPPSNPPPQP